jgi:hypothetical protein
VYPAPALAPSARTAKTLILIAFILQAIEVAFFLLIGVADLFAPFLSLVALGFGVIGILWLVVVYLFAYRRTAAGAYASAQTATLVFGILSLVTLSLVSGILYLVAYAELSNAQAQPISGAPTWGGPPPPPGARYCSTCGRANAPHHNFCQACGSRLA